MGIRRIRVVVLIVVGLFFLNALSHAQTKTFSELDGSDWQLSAGLNGGMLNVGRVQGLIMGTSVIHNQINHLLEVLSRDENITEFQKFQVECITKQMRDLALYGISTGQLNKGIDTFYEDFSNQRIKIIDALFVVKMQIEGKEPDLIQAQIRYLRMQPIDSQAWKEARKKKDALLFGKNEKLQDSYITNEDLKSGKITEEELFRAGTFVDKNNVNYELFCYGLYK